MILRPASLTMPDAAFFLEIKDVVLVDEDGNLSMTDDQIVANGSIEFEPEVHFLERIGNGKAEVLPDRPSTSRRQPISNSRFESQSHW